MGDHTDYQEGWCLPMAIDRSVTIARAPRAAGRCRPPSSALPARIEFPADGTADPRDVEPVWGRTVAAALRVLADRGRAAEACDLGVASTVPIGSGLSSSAAFGVACMLA